MAEKGRVRPGPAPGSDGAMRIAEAHKGSHEHDRRGGFAADPAKARQAGKNGGEIVKAKYGSGHYEAIGYKGGCAVRDARGSEFYSMIGKKGRAAAAERRKVANGHQELDKELQRAVLAEA